MPCSEGAAEPAASSIIATACQDCATTSASPPWNRLCVVSSSRVTGGLDEAGAAGTQHREYRSVLAAGTEEVVSCHGKARRRYISDSLSIPEKLMQTPPQQAPRSMELAL